MLTEIANVYQNEPGVTRRWFEDDFFELIVWYRGGALVGFQLLYEAGGSQKALTWHHASGTAHDTIDGEKRSPLSYPQTPILVADGPVPLSLLVREFEARAAGIEGEIRDLVLGELTRPGRQPAG